MTSDGGPLVSIALPVRNGGSEIALAVQSVLRQSLEDWELILVDDGSTDGTLELLRHFNDPRIRLVADGQNRGLATRLNEMIALARGRYFARMDHDDFAHPHRLQSQVEYLEAHGDVDLVAVRCLTMFDDERIVGELPFAGTHAEICRRPWLGLHMPHPSWMGRTDWFRRHRYAEPAPYCCEDQELLLRAYPASRYHALAVPLLAYRLRRKVALGKLIRTRLALASVQAAIFKKRGRFGFLVLSLVAFVVRAASDLVREIAPGLRSDLRPISTPETDAWNEMMAAQRAEASTKR